MKAFDLASYSLDEPLPAGGLTQAFRATRRTPQGPERVIVKQLLIGFSHKDDIRASWLAAVARAPMFTHDACVRVLDFGECQGALGPDAFMALEYVEGASLSTILRGLRRAKERLSIPAALHITRVLLDVLEQGHQAAPAFLHHDVGAHSVRIDTAGRVRISEGATWDALPPKLTLRARYERGRVVYQSPEQANSRAPDARSELFSIGVLLFEMLAGQRPFQGPTQLAVAMAIADARRKPLREVAPDVAPPLADIVERLLAPAPDARFQSTEDVRLALSAWPASEVHAELAHWVAEFRPLENRRPGASDNNPSPLPPPAGDPQTLVGAARPAPSAAPALAPAASVQPVGKDHKGEPRTSLGYRLPEELRRPQPSAAAKPSAPAPSSEPGTRMHGLFQAPMRPSPATPAAPSSAPVPAQAPAPKRAEPVFGGAAATGPAPERRVPSPVPPPRVEAPSTPPVRAAEPTPPPMLPPPMMPYDMPPLVAEPPAPPYTAPARVEEPALPPMTSEPAWVAPSEPARIAPAPAAMAPSPAAPMVSDGKTAFLDRDSVRLGMTGAAPAPAPPPSVAPPKHVAPAFAPAPAEFVLREPAVSAPSASSDVPHALSPSDRGWKDPSATLFRAKSYAKDPTRRERASIPLPVVVTLSVVFGFALVAGGYFLLRLFQ